MDSCAAPLIGRRLLARAAGAAAGALLLLSTAHAELVAKAFDDRTAFETFFESLSVPLPRTSFDFQGLPLGAIPNGSAISSGSPSIGDMTFNYSIDGVQLAVVEASPGDKALGTTDGGVLQAGDGFSLAFAHPIYGVGMNFISSDLLFDGDIRLTVNGFTAGLAVRPNTQAYFLGLAIVDEFGSPVSFPSVAILTGSSECVACFLYNVDNIVMAGAVPEPSALWLLFVGLAGTGLLLGRRAQSLK